MVEGVNSSMIYIIYCKNFCKSHNVSPKNEAAGCWWLTPVILDTQEAEIRRIVV
jgi:hypothetical protein